MPIRHEVLVPGSNLSFEGGFFGFSSVVLVRAGPELVLFDTGHHPTRGLLLEALRARGLAPGDIGTVFLSHLHFDHANNIDLFAGARFVLSRREWDYAARPHPDDHFVPWLVHEALERFAGRLELVGDEGEIAPGLRHAAAPGHTPGLQTLSYEAASGERVAIAGDAIKTLKEALARRCDMAFDTLEAGTRSIERILANADRIVPGHFPELRREGDAWTWDEPARLNLIVR